MFELVNGGVNSNFGVFGIFAKIKIQRCFWQVFSCCDYGMVGGSKCCMTSKKMMLWKS